MDRKEALTRFKEEERAYLEEVGEAFRTGMREKEEEVADCLLAALSALRKAAEEGKKEKIMFFHFSLLRIDFLEGKYHFLAQAMSEQWVLDLEPAETTFSLECIFAVLDGVREKLKEDSRKYRGKINRYDIDWMWMETAVQCSRELAGMLRFLFRDIEENEDFKAMNKYDTWGVHWGEYCDDCERIASVDREKKEQRDFERMLRRTGEEENVMVSGFWYEAEIKNADCGGKTLCFVQFERCALSGINFGGADLTGARFSNCTLTDCCFDGAVLRLAVFSDCGWEACSFAGAELADCIFSGEAQGRPPFLKDKAKCGEWGITEEQLEKLWVDREVEI